jgi:hypothetical protein
MSDLIFNRVSRSTRRLPLALRRRSTGTPDAAAGACRTATHLHAATVAT